MTTFPTLTDAQPRRKMTEKKPDKTRASPEQSSDFQLGLGQETAGQGHVERTEGL